MGDFKRVGSKVWWATDSIEWREATSSSPGSQDSGFSDSENSPNNNNNNNNSNKNNNNNNSNKNSNKNTSDQNNNKNGTPRKDSTERIPKDIFKELSPDQKQNLFVNCKEKTTPNKSINSNLDKRLIQTDSKLLRKDNERINEINKANSQSPKKHRFTKNSPKVSRNLFSVARQHHQKDNSMKDVHQYSKDAIPDVNSTTNTNEMVFNGYSTAVATQSLPLHQDDHNNNSKKTIFFNKTDPNILAHEGITSFNSPVDDDEEVTSFNNSLSSDCESELECLFNSESPKHTSTPIRMRYKTVELRRQLYAKCQERVPPYHTDNKAVQKWIEDTKQFYAAECMTTLQDKSIAAELNQKVSHMAAQITGKVRMIITHKQCIEREYKHLNSETKHIAPLAQSLAGNIIDFLKHHKQISPKILKQYDDIRLANAEEALKLVSYLFNTWQLTQQDILVKEIKYLVDKLENPISELDLRATITGITSISLRNECLIEIFIKSDIVPILLILCERCEGSSMRSLFLRALSTMCCSTAAIRQFEKFSGIQIISDTLKEDSRPEPERSEAVTLLAQVTAPWIEDNHTIKGLSDYSKEIVKALTKFIATTRCGQNLILCSAALANMSTMDKKVIKIMLHFETIKALLERIDRKVGVSIYFLEQVATLIANMSALEAAKQYLIKSKAPAALIRFLKNSFSNVEGDIEKRLQQKSIIALSRLCGDSEGAQQAVELGGVEMLVRLCKERNDRYDSDAVLVASLATLRKIVEICGNEVIKPEDAQELIQPKLLDSFLAYSSQSESYV